MRNIQHVAVAQPAAGAQAIYTMPDGEVIGRLLVGVQFTLATSATVTNRSISFAIYLADGTTEVMHVTNAAVQAATVTNVCAFGVTMAHLSATGGRASTPMPDHLRIPGGWKIATRVANIQVGDQISAVNLLFL